jgi:hypothetical protein
MEFPQANSPNDLPAGPTIHMRSAFQVWTVQAERKVKLYVYGGPNSSQDIGEKTRRLSSTHRPGVYRFQMDPRLV